MNAWSLLFAPVGHALLLPVRALRARRLIRRGSFVALTIDGPVTTLAEPTPWWRRRMSRATSLDDVRELAGLIARDPKVRGLVVELRAMKVGAALATSLRAVLVSLRDAQKTIVVYLPMGGGSRELLVASAATRIVMGPESSISPLGYAVEARYFRRALDKVGILPEVLARGEFKTAGESALRDSMSPEQREQLGAILDGLQDELLSSLSEGRGLAPEQARAVVDGGPYRADDAVARRLVDAKGYDDELPTLAHSEAGEPAHLVPAASYLSVRRRRSRAKRIGVVYVRGPIVSRAPFGVRRVAVDERVMGALRKARESKSISGVIVLIDSPGGSVLASDRIHHEVCRLAERKPVAAYMANVAASGGYYVAAAANVIVAQSTTVTGSIGVVAAHLVLGPLLEKLGIVTELVKRGARADMLSASRPFDEGERQAMMLEIDGYYRDFVDVVAKGRKRPAEEIEKLARGRVYDGRRAQQVGLVDLLGDFEVAVDWIRERLGEIESMDIEIVRPPRVTPKPPELSTPFVDAIDAMAGHELCQLAHLAFGVAPGERALAWSATCPPSTFPG